MIGLTRDPKSALVWRDRRFNPSSIGGYSCDTQRLMEMGATAALLAALAASAISTDSSWERGAARLAELASTRVDAALFTGLAAASSWPAAATLARRAWIISRTPPEPPKLAHARILTGCACARSPERNRHPGTGLCDSASVCDTEM